MDQDSRKQDPRSNTYAQVGDAEGLFKSLKWIDGSTLKKTRAKKQLLYRCPGWGRRRSPQVTMDHNTTTTGQSFHACVCHYNLCKKKSILYNLHTIFLSLYRYSTYPSIHSLLS